MAICVSSKNFIHTIALKKIPSLHSSQEVANVRGGNHCPLSLHYQGSIDFNTVNMHRIFGIFSWYQYILLQQGLIVYHMIHRDHIFQYTHSSRGNLLGNTAQGTVFLATLPPREQWCKKAQCRYSQASKMSTHCNALVVEIRWNFIKINET